ASEELVSTFKSLRDDIQTITSKAAQLERDSDEHSVVIETLNQSSNHDQRRCFRMVGGILIERNVKETLVDLIQHKDQIDQLTKALISQYQKKKTELVEFQNKWNIQLTSS
ncbi:Prefoldin, partial [Phakopsora pachyrhizi]